MRKRMGMIACVLAVALTGCAGVPELSQEDNDMAAEYMAGELLKYDKSYSHGFDYDRTVLIPTPEPTPTPTVTPSEPTATDSPGKSSSGKNGTTSTVQEVSLERVYGLSGVSIKQTGYSLRSGYSDSNSAEVTAAKGKRLLVVTFRVTNSSGKAVTVQLNKETVTYGLTVDGKGYGTPLTSIINHDMQFFNERIPAGKSRKCVLIYEIPSGVGIKNAAVSVSNGSKAATVALR